MFFLKFLAHRNLYKRTLKTTIIHFSVCSVKRQEVYRGNYSGKEYGISGLDEVEP